MKGNSINARKEANEVLRDYVKKKSEYNFIHFARQNCFDDVFEKGPRIIAIAVMDAEDEQIKIFSLKKSLEGVNGSFFDLDDDKKDKIEKNMLDAFFEYVKKNEKKKWLHWNMKNYNFGFATLEERYRTLGGNPKCFEEEKLINISVLLKKKYGTNFAKDCVWNGKMAGKMCGVFKLNKISDSKILNGEEEVREYIQGSILSIEQSVLAKIKAFKIVVEKATDDELKTGGNVIKDVYGLSLSGVAQYIQDNAILALLFTIVGGVVATIICKLIGL